MIHLWHRWVPVKGFFTQGWHGGEYYSHQEPWTGYKCRVCKKKKIVDNFGQLTSRQATQAAYDWLNDAKKEGNQ